MSEYRFDLLGWFQFERLCQTLLTVPYGVSIEAWGGQSDWGRDAWCEGSLDFPTPGRSEPGPFLFQCKFIEDAMELKAAGVAALRKNLGVEAQQIERRIDEDDWQPPKHYVVMTNVRVPSKDRSRVAKTIAKVLPATSVVHLLDEPQIDVMVSGAPHVRLSFPQILSIRDLAGVFEAVINRDLDNRSRALLEHAAELSTVFVPTHAHGRTVSILGRHNFVVLTGPPEMGKSSIAKMVALARAAEDWRVVQCESPHDFDRVYRNDEPQVFVADDTFGRTEYVAGEAEAWGRALPRILPQLDSRHWLVWTSRSAPFHEGIRQLDLEGTAANFPDPGEVVVQARNLSVEEKALMLYRHAKVGKLSEFHKSIVRTYASSIVDHDYFTPLRVERFVSQRLSQLKSAAWSEVSEAIDEELGQATTAMQKSFDGLPPQHQELLLSLLDVKQRYMTLENIRTSYERHRSVQGELPLVQLIAELEEHFLEQAGIGDEALYEWVHPSWRDVLVAHLMARPQDRARFLSAAGVEGLVLALSTEGGASGERARPLLRTPDDWSAATTRLDTCISDSNSTELTDLLAQVANLVRSDLTPDDLSAANYFARVFLTGVADRWNADSHVLDQQTLRTFWNATLHVSPMVPSPQLDATLSTVLDPLEKANDGAVRMTHCLRSLHFLELLQANEPRTLVKVDFPTAFQEGLSNLVGCVLEILPDHDAPEEEYFDYEYPDATPHDAKSHFSELHDTLMAVVAFVPKYSDELSEAIETAEWGERLADASIRDFEERAEEEAVGWLKSLDAQEHEGETDEPFDVSRIFSDL